MPTDDRERLEVLYQTVLEHGFPAPELLARYVTAPNALSEEERMEVESAAARFPAVADELDTLRGFDFRALDADLQENTTKSAATLLRKLFLRPSFAAGLVASAALTVWLSLGQGWGDGVQPTPVLASARSEESIADPALYPVPTHTIPEAVELARQPMNSD